jgi:fumarate reductase flavoprotein subunit
MNPSKTSSTENLQTDIIIIGGGGAGLAAAIAAEERGVNHIIVLEEQHVPGGNAVFPEGIFAAESGLQKRLGIDARKDDLFKQAMNYAHWKTNPRLVRTLINKSGDTIRWLEEKGVKFVQVVPVYPSEIPLTFHCTRGPGRTGAAVVRALVKKCEDLDVQILYQTKAKKLLTNKNGSVIGVLAKAKNDEFSITSKSVIIATGGFTGNKELLKYFLPSYNEDEIHYTGITRKGDGLLLATEIGAATEGMVVLEMLGPAFPWSKCLPLIARRPDTIWVNKKGERFADEAITFLFSEAANSIYRQPGKISYSIFDEKIKQDIIEKRDVSHTSWETRVDKELQSQADKGRVKISNSWDKIAQWIGATPKVLKSTIDEYNFFCDQKYDDIFVKDRKYLVPLRTPPYYAIQCCIDYVATHGGIKINHHMEVLNHQDKPICGLYAAGVETGGTDSDTYNVNLAGHSFGFTINSGRIAGENAAEYIFRGSQDP